MRILVSILALIFLKHAMPAWSASFDCNKAAKETEIAICADPELSVLDDLMGILYSEHEKTDLTILEQKKWLKFRDNCFSDTSCIKQQYITRLSQNPFLIQDFQIIKIQDTIDKKMLSAVLTSEWLAYNGIYHLYLLNHRVLRSVKWQSPIFDESKSTCGLKNLKYDDGLDFEILDETYGLLNLQTTSSYSDKVDFGEEIIGVSINAKWVGHGDQSHEIIFKLQDNIMVATKILVDNCIDQEIRQIPLKHDD